MMTAESNKWKGFSYIPEEVIKKSDRYIFHRDDGEKVSDKVITCDEQLAGVRKNLARWLPMRKKNCSTVTRLSLKKLFFLWMLSMKILNHKKQKVKEVKQWQKQES